MRKILLVEPDYHNKYPPLGLMKLATFHKERGDEVIFVKGFRKDVGLQIWDQIYISTLFSFHWNKIMATIKYYSRRVSNPSHLFIGGAMATVMAEEIENETGFKPIKGLLNTEGKLGIRKDGIIDSIVPDYSILDQIDYKYPVQDAYFAYATRGCVRTCPFCAVHIIEPSYVPYISLKDQIKKIRKKHGDKKDLLLLDNNILASPYFERIIDEIKDLGFIRGAKLNNKKRHVDFNQGLDLRFLTKRKMQKLAELPVKPLRIAFDNIMHKDGYIEKIEWAAECGLVHLSNYILYNFDDRPEDFYERLLINIELNERLQTRIFSFPMKYIPINAKDRKFVGMHWNRRYLRGIQCILNATHGVVGPKRKFFQAAFGSDVEEFKRIVLMPDNFIVYRDVHKNNGALQWKKLFDLLTSEEKEEFLAIIHKNPKQDIPVSQFQNLNQLLSLYLKESSAAAGQKKQIP